MAKCGNILEGFPSEKILGVHYGSAIDSSTLQPDQIYIEEDYNIDGSTRKQVKVFGGWISTNAKKTYAPVWVAENTNYTVGSKVYIDAYKSVFICGQDGNTEEPFVSAFWKRELSNDMRMFSEHATEQTFADGNIIVDYDLTGHNAFVCSFVDGCKEIIIEKLDVNFQVIEEYSRDVMSYVPSFECLSCCNPPPVQKTWLYKNFKNLSCDENLIRVTFVKRTEVQYMKIGLAIPIMAIPVGAPEKMYRKLDNGITFERTEIDGRIGVYNRGSTIEINVDASITAKDKRLLLSKMDTYNGLTVTIFDIEVPVYDGVILGKYKMTGSGIESLLDRKTSYSFIKQGILA